MRRIKRGLSAIPSISIPRLVEIAVEAERMGFARIYLPDEGMIHHDPFMIMAAIALKTNRIQIGAGITNPYIRHPGITAAATATLAEMSANRAFLGISSGGTMALKPLCIVPEKPVTAVREMIITCRSLFRGEPVTFHGKTVDFNSAKLSVSKPGIEIWVVGRGPKMMKMAGELADGVILGNIHRDLMQKTLDYVREGAKISGNKPKICYFASLITDEETLEEERAHMAYNLIDSPPEVRDLLSISTGEFENIRHVLASEGQMKTRKLIKKEWVEPFVIMGSVEECRTELLEMITKYQIDEFYSKISWLRSPIKQMEKIIEIVPDQAP